MAAPTPAGQQMGPGCLAAVFSSSYPSRADGSNPKSLCHQSSLPPQPQVSPCQVEPPGGFSPPNLLPSKSFLCTEPGSLGRVGLAARPGSLGPPLRGGSGDKQPREWGGPRPLALQPWLHRADTRVSEAKGAGTASPSEPRWKRHPFHSSPRRTRAVEQGDGPRLASCCAASTHNNTPSWDEAASSPSPPSRRPRPHRISQVHSRVATAPQSGQQQKVSFSQFWRLAV